MTLPEPSAEQRLIIENLGQGNVLVDSVAGSGKTTTNLHIAKAFADKNILLLTYNSKLKVETREKVRKLGLVALEVHSYHAFCVKYYDPACFRDDVMARVVRTDAPPKTGIAFDIIILDEAQDIKPLFYALICKIVRDNIVMPRFCVLGDRYQSIYGFSGADARFITLAPELYEGGREEIWAQTTLSTSFRVTDTIAAFVNNCMLGLDRIRAQKPGPKVRYLVANSFGMGPYEEFKRYLALGGPSEIFVLAYSVKSPKTPVRALANRISALGIPIYVPLSDEGVIKEEETAGKVLFSTFHQSKGLERKYVIVFGFDNSYFKYYAKNDDPARCPNLLYVAATRASQALSVIHHVENEPLPFLAMDLLPDFCDVIGKPKIVKKVEKPINYAVTQLTRHLLPEVIARALEYVNITEITPSGQTIDVPESVLQKSGLIENVCDITGTAIPAFYELQTSGAMEIHHQLLTGQFDDVFKYARMNIGKKLARIKIGPDMTIRALLELATMYSCYRSEFVHKINQIDTFNWITKAQLRQFVERVDGVIGREDLSFERSVRHSVGSANIGGQIDCIVKGRDIYEFKCTAQLEDVHKLQLGIYMFMAERQARARPEIEATNALIFRYFLFNIRTGQILQMTSDWARLQALFEYIWAQKQEIRAPSTDDEFRRTVALLRGP